MEDEQPFSIVDLLGGIFVGLVIGVACFLLDVPVVALLGRFTPFLNALVLGALAVYEFKRRDQGFGRGMLISLSLVFILNTICGINFFRSSH